MTTAVGPPCGLLPAAAAALTPFICPVCPPAAAVALPVPSAAPGLASSSVAACTADCCCGWRAQAGDCGPHPPSCTCVGAQMVRIRRQVQLLLHTRTVPSADAEATSTEAENSPWLWERPSLLLGRGVALLDPSAAAAAVAKGSGLWQLGMASWLAVWLFVGPALLRPRASRCTTSSL